MPQTPTCYIQPPGRPRRRWDQCRPSLSSTRCSQCRCPAHLPRLLLSCRPSSGPLLAKAACIRSVHTWCSGPHCIVTPACPRRRGKRNQKHYTVFVAAMTPEAKAAFVPRLNKEHSAWRWFPLQEAMAQLDLHPVVNLVLGQQGPHSAQVAAALQGATAPAAMAPATAEAAAAVPATAAAAAPAAAAPAAAAAAKSRHCCSII